MDKLSTIHDLESEIFYLRSLLDANGISYDYQAYKELLTTVDDKEIDFPELTREQAIAFYGMFRGRKDVFAQRSAKKGYHTKCNNFWKYGLCPKKTGQKMKCGECPNQDYTKLTSVRLKKYFSFAFQQIFLSLQTGAPTTAPVWKYERIQ